MTIYNDRQPYVYLLGWTYLPKPLAYVGRRTAKGCHPDELLKKYQTSSKIVKRLLKAGFMPDKVNIISCKTEKIAIIIEERLQRNFEVIKQERWLNQNINGKWYVSNLGRVAWNKGVPRSEETKEKLRIANKGKLPPNTGIPHSEESKQKMRRAKEGRVASAETRLKQSTARKGLGNANSDRMIYKYVHKDGREYIGTRYEFSQYIGVKPGSIWGIVNGIYKTCKGWSFHGQVQKDI